MSKSAMATATMATPMALSLLSEIPEDLLYDLESDLPVPRYHSS